MAKKIAVFGSAVGVTKKIEKNARTIGSEVAIFGYTLVTGACSGISYEAVLGAKKHNGKVVGYSPAVDLGDHIKQKLPTDGFTKFCFSPKKFANDVLVARKYRNVLSCQACDAGIIISGRIGTLNEFTNLYDMGKVIGVLMESGGSADLIPTILQTAKKKSQAMVVFATDPKVLVKQVIDEIKKRDKKI